MPAFDCGIRCRYAVAEIDRVAVKGLGEVLPICSAVPRASASEGESAALAHAAGSGDPLPESRDRQRHRVQ